MVSCDFPRRCRNHPGASNRLPYSKKSGRLSLEEDDELWDGSGLCEEPPVGNVQNRHLRALLQLAAQDGFHHLQHDLYAILCRLLGFEVQFDQVAITIKT